MSPARSTFWTVDARRKGCVPFPRNMSLNWFMPAPVNSSVGSFAGTSDALGYAVCPFDAKNDCQRRSQLLGLHRRHRSDRDRGVSDPARSPRPRGARSCRRRIARPTFSARGRAVAANRPPPPAPAELAAGEGTAPVGSDALRVTARRGAADPNDDFLGAPRRRRRTCRRRRCGAHDLLQRAAARAGEAERLLRLGLERLQDVLVLAQERDGLVAALAELRRAEGEPRARLVDDAGVGREVERGRRRTRCPRRRGCRTRPCGTAARSCSSRPSRACGCRSTSLALLERADAAHVEAHRGVELERVAARRRLGVAEHHADLHADLVGEDHHGDATGRSRR